MKVIKKCYKIIMIIFIVSMILCTNNVFAYTWNEFVEDAGSKVQAAKNWEDLIDRYYKDPDYLKGISIEEMDVLLAVADNGNLVYELEEEAKKEAKDAGKEYKMGDAAKNLEALRNGEQRIKQVKQDTLNNQPPEEGDTSLDRAQQLYDEIVEFCNGDLSQKTDDEVKDCYAKLKEYDYIVHGELDSTMSLCNEILRGELDKRNIEVEDPIEGNPVGDGGEVAEPVGPSTGLLGNADASASHTPDEIIGEANDFLDKGSAVTTIDGGNLKQASSTLYNILLSIGILLAVGIGMYLGVKFMVSTAEDKAKVKEAMIPYIAGCIVIFSAFVIWKAAILLFGQIG